MIGWPSDAGANHAGRQARAAALDDRESGVLHDHVDLVVAVDADGLLVDVGVVPVVEDAVAAAKRRGLWSRST